MSAYTNADERRPLVTLAELQAIDAIVRRSVPATASVMELAVLPARDGTPSPLEVRVTLQMPDDPETEPRGWAQQLSEEIRHGWDRVDFMFTIRTVTAA